MVSVSGLFQRLFLCTLFLLLGSFDISSATRKLNSLLKQEPLVLKYHNGVVLTSDLSVNIVWYGRFTSAQKSILLDFLLSLNSDPKCDLNSEPSVSSWWKILESYSSVIPILKNTKNQGNAQKSILLNIHDQLIDETCSMGKFLTRKQVSDLAYRASTNASLVVILTAGDVAVEGICIGGCARHSSIKSKAYVWVGNPGVQCPGECAWPFHRPIYGPQSPPLVAPNGDVGIDGMIIGLASSLAGAVTNPLGTGFFLGLPSALLEAATVCAGKYGKGAYPGYAGDLLLDSVTGGSYNSHGINGRKFLLPAIWNPATSSCSTLV